MRQWIGIVEELLEKHHRHRHRQHHTSGIRYGFFPRLGIYACGMCGAHNPMAHSTSSCPSCGTSSAGAAVNSGSAAPPAATGGAAAPAAS